MMRWSVNGSINSPYLMVLIQTVITIAISALYFKAFDRLKKRQYAGWVYVFYAGMLAFVANLFAGSVLGAILSFIINMYFIFQAKELYN